MDNKKYYWLKLKDDFFASKEIKKLRQIAGGDTYTIIYLKMQLKSLKNNGKLYYEGFEDDFMSELALDIDENPENVKITLLYLEKHNLIDKQIIGNIEEYILPIVQNSTGSESASAARVRRHRAAKLTLQSNALTLQSNGHVTKCNTEIEKEKEKEIDIEKKKRKYTKEKNVSTDFLTFFGYYPHRPGNSKSAAYRNWKARIAEGYTADNLIAAAIRYQKYCVALDRIDTEYVLKASNFLGRDKHFLENWEVKDGNKQRKSATNHAADVTNWQIESIKKSLSELDTA